MTKTLLLGKTFFKRFFETDLMPPGLPQVQLLIGSLTLLAGPGLLLPAMFAARYAQMEHDVRALAHAIILHRLLFVTLTMIGLGLVALVTWEGVFPDRRDARILGVLPLSRTTFIAARLGALGALAGIFIAGANAVPTLMYGPVLAGYGAAATPLHGAAAHLVATCCAGAFVFFGLIALQGALLNLAARRTAERLSIVLQVVFAVGLLQLIFFFPRMRMLFGHDLADLTGHPVMRFVPSVWFLALYDVVGGRPSPGSMPLAALGIITALSVTLAAVGLFIATHDRLTRRALESRDSAGAWGRLIRRRPMWLDTVSARTGIERGIRQFTLRTLVRSRTHRMLLALYLGVAVALAVSGLVPLLVSAGTKGLFQLSIPLLSAPLVVIFLGLVGMRTVFALPVEPKSNWILRLLEPADRMAAIDGARDAMMLAMVVPVSILTFVTSTLLLGLWPAVVHTTVCLVLGWILAEALMLTLPKLPFSCTYYPGLSRVRTLWPLYLTVFSTYCYSTPFLEYEIVRQPRLILPVVGTGILAGVALRVARARRLRALPGFRFEEEDPTAMFEGFHLSEGLAAARPADNARRI